MEPYPIMLRLTGRRAVVVGSGTVGLRRAAALAQAGADVTLCAEHLAGEPPEGAEIVRESYRSEMLAGATLVLACTGDRATNAQIAADARRAGALVNCADQPEDCDFYLPAVARRGPVCLAVGTGGAAPGLSRRLRDRLARRLSEEIGEFAAAVGEVRARVQEGVEDRPRRMEILAKLTGPVGYAVFLDGGREALGHLTDELLSKHDTHAADGSGRERT